jgi:hypothetical protein
VCGDGIDNDCDREIDEGCGDAGVPDASDAGDAADVSDDVFDEPVPDLSARVTGGLLVLYAFMEGRGDVVKDYAATDPLLNLRIDGVDGVTWLDGGGLQIDGPVTIATENSATRVIEACRKSNAITVEAWVKPATVDQQGPARILGMSFNPYLRNFTLGQEKGSFDFRLRTTATDENGTPSLVTDAGVVTTKLTHVVYVRNSGGLARFVIDGQEAGMATVEGDMSTWASDYRLIVGNEFQEGRVWRGTIYLAAVYERSLTPDDIAINYAAGRPSPR